MICLSMRVQEGVKSYLQFLVHHVYFQHVEEFVKSAEHAVSELERLRQRVGGTQRLRLSTAEEVLMDSAEMYDNIRELTQQVLTAGN